MEANKITLAQRAGRGRPKVHVDLPRALQELSRGVSQGKVAEELGVSLSTLKNALAKHGVRAVKTWRVPD